MHFCLPRPWEDLVASRYPFPSSSLSSPSGNMLPLLHCSVLCETNDFFPFFSLLFLSRCWYFCSPLLISFPSLLRPGYKKGRSEGGRGGEKVGQSLMMTPDLELARKREKEGRKEKWRHLLREIHESLGEPLNPHTTNRRETWGRFLPLPAAGKKVGGKEGQNGKKPRRGGGPEGGRNSMTLCTTR